MEGMAERLELQVVLTYLSTKEKVSPAISFCPLFRQLRTRFSSPGDNTYQIKQKPENVRFVPFPVIEASR